MPATHPSFDSAVVGGGFFGCQTALTLAAKGHKVLLLEQAPTLAGMASTYNQARLHNGYHYPRSLMTALGAHRHYARFRSDYKPFIINNFAHIYAVASAGSKTSAYQFQRFCTHLNIPCKPVIASAQKLFDTSRIAAAYQVEEAGLDTTKLMAHVHKRVASHKNITALTGSRCTALHVENRSVRLQCGEQNFIAHNVFNVTYGGLNDLLNASGLAPLGLKLELTEMALVTMPPVLKGLGFTIMDGPFFSCMPFGTTGNYTLSHVRYTPHAQITGADTYKQLEEYRKTNPSHFPFMRNDAARYVPAMRHVEYQSSFWQVKTVPLKHETDDGRPILLREHVGTLGQGRCVVSVLGSKLDSVYEWKNLLEEAF
ncbi:MAG TPA: FAD-dependent oxidoreductase [Alphaproteobacteria bacterium]|nr:FAD-dependent oxidoreductase [Alphaproteobacteria bacterium]